MQYPKTEQPTISGPEDAWPEEELERVKQCPVCGSSDREVMHEGLVDQVFFCAPGQWTLHRCQKCSSGYLDPRPSRDSIGLAYQQYYTHGSADERKSASDLNGIHRLRRKIANGYRNVRYGTNYQPASTFSSWMFYLVPSYKRILDREMRHLPKLPPDGKLLDIGCGDGGFLKRAEEAGWKAKGIDPDPQAVEVAQNSGLDVKQGGVEILENERELYDVITLSHVIEHAHDPRAMLVACHRLLKSDGILWIETPNLNSIGHKRYGQSWRGLEPPRHLVLFSFESMKHALHVNGFRDIGAAPVSHFRVEKHVLASSSNIERGKDPYDREKVPLSVHILASFAALRLRFDPGVAEFITLTATKP